MAGLLSNKIYFHFYKGKFFLEITFLRLNLVTLKGCYKMLTVIAQRRICENEIDV